MVETTTKARRWGNSLGIVLPKDQVESEGISPGDDLEVFVRKTSNTARKLFGRHKGTFKGSTQQLMDEIRDELYGKDVL